MSATRLVLCMNILKSAPTQFTNYNFNSFCNFQGVNLAASGSGIFAVDSGSLDNTTKINAHFKSHTTDFAEANQKRMRSMYIGGMANGTLELVVTNDEINERIREFELSDATQRSVKISIGRGTGDVPGKGRYWNFLVRNTEGCDFSVDVMEVIAVVLNRHV